MTQNTFLTGFRKSDTVLEGWLTKKKGTKHKWDRKYFVLNQQNLRYYSPCIKGQLNLAGGCDVRCVCAPFRGALASRACCACGGCDNRFNRWPLST